MIKIYPKFFFITLVLIINVVFFGLIWEFLLTMFWAIVFAILFRQRFEKFLDRFPNKPNLAAGLTLGLYLLIVIVPAGVITLAVVNEATQVYEELTKKKSLKSQVEGLQEAIPLERSTMKKLGLRTSDIKSSFTRLINKASEYILGNALNATQNIFVFFVNFAIMLYVFFFFVRDGKRLVQELIWVIPMDDKKEKALLRRFESVSRATVKGSLLVALIQGMLGGILFYFVGISSPFLWGVVMTLASLLPIGSAIIWGPYALYFFMQEDVMRGSILLGVGFGFIGLIDNFLRPYLVGKDTKLPDYLILISTLGGISWFGISGFVLGPIVASLFVTCWRMMGTEFGMPRAVVVTEPTAEELAASDTIPEE